MRRRMLLISVVACLLLANALAREPAVDPSTGRIRIIYLGDAWGASSAYSYMIRDPMFRVTPVPASAGHMGGLPNLSRYIRLYVPRTYGRLVESYDIIILSDTVKAFYRPQHLMWFRDSVEKDGKGIVMVGGREIQWGDWTHTPVEQALPVEWIPLETYEHNPFRALPTEPLNDFLRSLPWKTMPPYMGMNLAIPKPGARVLLKADVKDYPILVFGEYGKGAGLAHTPDWTPAWGAPVFYNWRYYPDYLANMMYLVAGAAIPEDPALMHDIRELYYNFYIQWGVVSSMMEFVERFGANVGPIEDALEKIDDERRDASNLYVKQEYPAVLERMKEARKDLDDAFDLAMRVKDRALLWIYITEATAVTGTSMLCGLVLWLLMIKRRLYREVETTHLA